MNRPESSNEAPAAGRSNLKRSRPAWPWLLVLLVGGAGAAWWWATRVEPGAAPIASPAAEPVAADLPGSPPAAVAPPGAAADPAPPLPPVVQADDRVRQALRGLSPLAELAAWLQAEDLARRFVAAVHAVADGESPRTSLAFLAPKTRFAAAERDGRAFAAPASHARYDLAARVVGSLDAQACAVAYRQLSPLFEAAHREIARPGTRFDDTLGRAVARLLATPVPAAEVELVMPEAVYQFADPELEALSAAQKHLLRTGPANARLIQAKLGEVAGALGLALPAAP